MKYNDAGLPIAENVPERKYIVVSRKFDGFSAAACPCVGQVATNSKLLAYLLYRRWNRFAKKNMDKKVDGYGYSIAVMLMKRNEGGTYDAIER